MQACFLGDVGVIWCNSLSDSHFQTYVMNNVESVIHYYQHITSHVSHAVTSCTYLTSYSLLNFVYEIVCEFGLAIQDYILYDFDTKCIHWIETLGVKCVKILFLKFYVENKCFWKTFKLILMHLIHEINWFDCFLHKLLLFFKRSCFPDFRSIECVSWPIKNPLSF